MTQHRMDTIVIGGSAGSLGPLREILRQLPADLAATVLVVMHLPTFGERRLVELLAAVSALPVREAEDGVPAEPGCVLVAGPDRHLMLGKDHVHLRRGAHENNFRPAIDPLFRSAAVYRGPRAVGLILSGLMDDGAAGARALALTGGTILVQSPDSAEQPGMPRAALNAVAQAEAVDPSELPSRLAELIGTPCAAPQNVPLRIGVELRIAGLEGADMAAEERLGELSPYNCPHCNGVLWEIEDGPLTRFRCHTGHAYTLENLSAAQEEALEQSLFNALRAHKGRAALLRRMVERQSTRQGMPGLEERARRVAEDARTLEEIITARRQSATDRSVPNELGR